MGRYGNWMERNPRKTKLLLLLGFGLILFTLAEIYLAARGFEPGHYYRHKSIQRRDTLRPLKGCVMTPDGIQVVAPFARKWTAEYINGTRKIRDNEFLDLEREGYAWENMSICEHSRNVIAGKAAGPMPEILDSLKNAPDKGLTPLGKAWKNYLWDPINEEGFRSIPFQRYDSNKTHVLLIADSFGWGHTADNFLNSFADRVSAAGYPLWNASISGTDPAQYELIAEKYIPKLKPDVVLVNIFLGNDIVYFDRETGPDKWVYYPTNFGNLMADPEGVHLDDYNEVWDIMEKRSTIPTIDVNWFAWFCSKTRVFSVIWGMMANKGWVEFRTHPDLIAYEAKKEAILEEKPVTLRHLRRIKAICEANDAKFILMIIPDCYKWEEKVEDLLPGIEEFEYHLADDIERGDFHKDGHYIDSGHEKHARTLLRLMREAGMNP